MTAPISDYVYAGAAARLIDDSKCLMKTAVGNNGEREIYKERQKERKRGRE